MRRRSRGWLRLAVLVVAGAAIAYAVIDGGWSPIRGQVDLPICARASRVTMPICIVAGGELASVEAIEVSCEVEGAQTKIIEMMPEGAVVKQGQVVMRLDPSEVNLLLAQQKITVTQADAAVKDAEQEVQIQKNLAASQVAQAKLALTLAELDKTKYLEGDYGVELNEIQGSIALAETDLQDATDMAEYFRELVKKGFRTPEQLRAKEQAVKRAEFYLRRDQEKLQVLQRFTRERQVAELTAKAEDAALELERVRSTGDAAVSKAETDLEVARATANLEHQQLEKLEFQLEQCTVRAPVDGTLVYANTKNLRVVLGTVVHYKQRLFGIPDMSRMQVKAFVHESEVKKVSPGVPATIRVGAFPNLELHGTVTEVATFYDTTRQWLSGGVKDYATVVDIDDLPDVGLKPGMSTQVKLQVGAFSDNLVVPIAAVTAKEGHHYCYVDGVDRIERRRVTIGMSTADYVEIRSGLREGEQVALDARHRSATDMEDGSPAPEAPSDQNSATGAASG